VSSGAFVDFLILALYDVENDGSITGSGVLHSLTIRETGLSDTPVVSATSRNCKHC
jgi:hypothetical protein